MTTRKPFDGKVDWRPIRSTQQAMAYIARHEPFPIYTKDLPIFEGLLALSKLNSDIEYDDIIWCWPSEQKASDNVRHPSHYTTGKIEVKDFDDADTLSTTNVSVARVDRLVEYLSTGRNNFTFSEAELPMVQLLISKLERRKQGEIEGSFDGGDCKYYMYWAPSVTTPTSTNDNVRHPSHYTTGKIEVKDFIADKELNYFRGCVVKYVVRAGLKDPEKTIEDLEKAKVYIDFEIERIRNAASK